MRTIVLDTNVLLSDPEVLFAFPGDEIIVPETVLGELDKIKTSRADPDLRYRGRKVSRHLFDLSEEGALTTGVDLPNGGSLRVVSLDPDFKLPNGLTLRNADDRILAVSYQVCKTHCEDLILVTNDLNMLLKAQMFGVAVERYEDGAESSFARRYIVRPFQRYKIPLGILGLSLAVFVAIVVLTLMARGDVAGGSRGVPSEFRGVLSEQQERILDFLLRLEDSPTDLDATLGLANEYYDLREHTGSPQYAELARTYYEQYLLSRRNDADVRTDLAITYYILGDSDRAIQEAVTVLRSDPDHVNANYNLGIFYWKGRGQYSDAVRQFQAVIELTADATDSDLISIHDLALSSLDGVLAEAEAAGQPIQQGGGA